MLLVIYYLTGSENALMQLDSPSMQQLLTAHEIIGDAACMCASCPDCRHATACRALSALVMRLASLKCSSC